MTCESGPSLSGAGRLLSATVDVGQILLGGGITLAGTVLVQVYVIPHVQARTRGRERWEEDVDELVSSLDDKLPRTLDTYKWATYKLDQARSFLADDERFATYRRSAEADSHQADEAVGERMAELHASIRRISRFKSRRPLLVRARHALSAPALCAARSRGAAKAG